MRLLVGVAGLALAVLHVGRHPATRRLSEDAVDACEYCERLTRDWETRVCRILSGGAGDGRGFADFFFSGIAANATRAPRYECSNSRFVSFRRLDVTRVNRISYTIGVAAVGPLLVAVGQTDSRPAIAPCSKNSTRRAATSPSSRRA